MRFLASILAFGLFTTMGIVAQEKKDDAKSSREEQLQGIFKDFVKQRNEATLALRRAKTDEEREAARKKQPQEKDYLPRVMELVRENAKDGVAIEALTFAVYGLDSSNPDVMKKIEAAIKEPTMEKFLAIAMNARSDAGKPILLKIMSENPERELQGKACFALGNMAFSKNDPESAKEAEKYFLRIEKEFADIKTRRGTLGDSVKGYLFEIRNLGIGMKAPEATSKDLKGEPVKLADYKGKVVVLDIWATWCGPCIAMIPHEREMVEKFKDKPFTLISVSADEEKETLEKFLEKQKMPWVHWWEGSNARLLKEWNVRFFPTIYVIDANGVIRHKNIRGAELEKAVEKLIAEAK